MSHVAVCLVIVKSLKFVSGERPAAMQTGSAGLSNSSINIVVVMIICYIYSTIYKRAQLERTEMFGAWR